MSVSTAPLIVAPPLSVAALSEPVVTKPSYSAVASTPKPLAVPHIEHYTRVNNLLFSPGLKLHFVSPKMYGARIMAHTLDAKKPMIVAETNTHHVNTTELDLGTGVDWCALHIRQSSTPPAVVQASEPVHFGLVRLANAATVPLSKRQVKAEYSDYEIDNNYVSMRERKPSPLHSAIQELENALGRKLHVRLYHAKKGHMSNANEFAKNGTLASALNTQDTTLVFE